MFASEFDSGLENIPSKDREPDSSSEKDLSKPKNKQKFAKSKSEHEDKSYKPSLFRRNPDLPTFTFKHDVEPIKEPLFSEKSFSDCKELHPHMIANLEQTLNVTKLTAIQDHTIPVLQAGHDALIRSQTGSGKTLAYAIPIVEKLHHIRPKLTRQDGMKVMIVLPTRELAIQTYEWFVKLVKPFTWLVPGLLIGGEKRKSEKARLRKGITILIGTPGRLLDHAKNTKCVSFQYLEWLVIDEADRLLELGYEKDITSLLEILDNQVEQQRKTVLLSATLTKEVERLASLSLHNPVLVDVTNTDLEEINKAAMVIPDSLSQHYIVVPPKLRLVTLASILLDKCSKSTDEGKILVFMGTQSMVDYHTELFSTVLPDINFYKLHGKMTQVERTEVFKSFRSYENGVLLCSDVAARGLDLPQVDWIVQYNAPITASDYVHRVGRTARVGSKGFSLIFLAPHEINFISMLQDHRVKITEQKMETYLQNLATLNFAGDTEKRSMESAATTLQVRFETALNDQEPLLVSGCEAYVSWVRFYASYPKEMRNVFNFKELHLGHYAKSFALIHPPKAISGIGKPKNFKKTKNIERPYNKLSFNKDIPVKRKATSNKIDDNEFGSGLKFKRKKKEEDVV
ncbi:probable ATP-dependent RNA helicase DDX31 [Planococcus citri]|uniref:probable ATP-dependent RNA helicase DDX31 n=1 Tax=Planococcus citri TaxID=170843 RepID=UPI0031F88214